MPVSLRTRSVNRPPAVVRKASTKRYDKFPDITECWEQSKAHQKYFMQYLDCHHKKDYHATACKMFDDLVSRWATGPYQRTFFLHYFVNGRLPRSTKYLDGLLTTSADITKYAACSLQRRTASSYKKNETVPTILDDWPLNFNLYDLMFTSEDRNEALESLEMCIKRRIFFRNACVKACCTKSDTKTHDQFLLILQILRAQLIDYE
jgi:hypothetical protein